jgi:phosphatidylserine/phosphatidylglycerophosphate/cardiolipin synthase-like enzyme
MTAIKAYANCDRAHIVWQLDGRIDGCLGFALYRRSGSDGDGEPLDTWVGFENDPHALSGTMKPSTEWPVQKFMWSDFAAPAGQAVSYRVVPMVGSEDDLQPDETHASDWSNETTATATADPGYSAYFNRGILASQWVSRKLQELGDEAVPTLEDAISKPGPIRSFLAGSVLPKLPSLLEGVSTIYAALYELNDPELIDHLAQLGPKANVVLANGAETKVGEDENAEARKTLNAANVNVKDRMVRGRHFAHNKFLVLCDDAGSPQAVWTGSTNWTVTGLCTQANNALLIEDPATAQLYLDQWHAIEAAGDDYPESLIESNDQERKTSVGDAQEQVFFTPVADQVDLDRATQLINGAQHGILFLMFNPGPAGTLLNAILERSATSSANFDPTLYIHGVINQDPSTTKHPVGLFTRGTFELAPDDVVLPEAIAEDFGFWKQELLKLPEAHAIVHSKTIVLDPFGEHPVVMTGSHNLGPKASSQNDDNLVIVEGAPALAAAYAVNIMGVYDTYRFRFRRAQAQKHRNGGARPAWHGLKTEDTWQDDYFTGAKARELRFWLGQPEPAS